MKRRLTLMLAAVLAFGLVSLSAAQQQDQPKTAPNPLVQLLQSKGVLTSQEAAAINQAATPAEQQQRLSQLLYSKGIITQDEYNKTAAAEAQVQAKPAPDSQGMWIPTAAHVSAGEPGPEPAMAMPPQAPAAPAVIPAVAPVRVLTNEPPKAGGLVPDIKLGSGAKLKLYGFVKATAAYDSSNPYNIGFELPGLGSASNGALPGDIPTGLDGYFAIPGVGNADSGPKGSPSFYLKGSATRMGMNFEWPDIAGGNNTLTGRIEGDFEGNFSRAQNRNVSSLRTRMLAVRLAWVRLDHSFSDATTGFILAGYDWTPFGSSNFANLLETEGGGAYFGSLYEREAQIRLGLWHDFGGSRHFMIGIEPAIGQPGFANNSTDVGVQLGVSERQGIDSGRPEASGRLVLQWQLDKARGVPPAQINISGEQARRVEIVDRAAINNVFCSSGVAAAPGALNTCENTRTAAQLAARDALLAAFPRGAQFASQRWGGDAGVQLPTRWATLMARYYTGADLKWYFAGQIFGEFSDTRRFVGGLFPTPAAAAAAAGTLAGSCGINGGALAAAGTSACPGAFDIDASAPNPVFGFTSSGTPVMVPQRPVRGQGGQAQLSFPLSRIFNANPAGRNAGWVVAFTAGTDQVKRRDVLAMTSADLISHSASSLINASGTRNRSDMVAGTITWKINQFATWAYESSVYLTKSTCAGLEATGGGLRPGPNGALTSCSGTLFRATPARYWHDWRNEFGPIFTF